MSGARSLVIGVDSGIGQALASALHAAGGEVLGTSRRISPAQGLLHLDMSGDLSGFAVPDGVGQAFLCAAVSATAHCTKDPLGTSRVNVDNTALLAELLAQTGAFVVFPSSNLVFDGAVPLRPSSSAPCPLVEYGRQKARAERQLLALGKQTAVVRITKVLASGMALFSEWAAELKAGRIVRPFVDMPMAPVTLDLVVRALLAIAIARRSGLWQISATHDISYAEAALCLANRLGADPALVQPVSWREASPSMEHVPTHTTLDSSRLAEELGIDAPHPLDSLAHAFGEYV